MKCLNELQTRGQAFREDCLATSLAVDNGAANSQISSLLPNPHLSRHRSTGELRVVGIETRDIAVPSRLQRSLVPSRTI